MLVGPCARVLWRVLRRVGLLVGPCEWVLLWRPTLEVGLAVYGSGAPLTAAA